MTTIDKIRAEIERRKKENMYVDLPMSIGRYYEDRDLLSFLDTLEELRESEDERIRKFLVDYFASYKIGNVTTKLNGVRIDDILNYLEKPGAEWMKKQIPMPEDTVIFQKGVEEGKRLMMEGAVEGTVIELGETYKDLSLSVNAKELNQVLQPLGVGDGNKVKIIIVKEEEQ